MKRLRGTGLPSLRRSSRASSTSISASPSTLPSIEGSEPDLKLRASLELIGEQLGLPSSDLSAWYRVRVRQVRAVPGADRILSAHKRSLIRILKRAYPEHAWDGALFDTKPRNYWKAKENQLRRLNEIRAKIGLKEGDHAAWYKVNSTEVSDAGGSVILALYRSSLSRMLMSLLPEFPWDITKFKKKPQKYWQDASVQRAYMVALCKKLGLKEGDMNAYYSINSNDLIDNGGTRLIKSHKSSMGVLLRAVFPEHQWDDSRFAKKPQRFWKSKENQKEFLDQVGLKLGFKDTDLSAWYKVTQGDLLKNGGGALLAAHNFSLYSVLQGVYPNHAWDPLQFTTRPRYSLSEFEEQRRAIEAIATALGISEGDLSGWYRFGNHHILKHGGATLLNQHKSSLVNLLMASYPEHPWDESLFSVKRRDYWKSKENQIALLERLALKLGHEPGDLAAWYGVSSLAAMDAGGSSLLLKYYNGSVAAMVAAVYPEHPWELWRFAATRRSSEEALEGADPKTSPLNQSE